MRRILLVLGAFGAASVFGLVACGGDDTGGTVADAGLDGAVVAYDAGADGTTPHGDASSHDAGADASEPDASDAAPVATDAQADAPDAMGDAALPGPSGTRLVDDASVSVWGVTSDDYVIYSRATSLYAVSVSGGAPITVLATFNPSSEVLTFGPNLLVWDGVTPAGGTKTGPLRAWSKANGTVSLSASAEGGFAATSPDGAWLAFGDNATGTTEDLVVVKSDGTSKATLVAGAARDACVPALAFGGDGAVFASYCTTPLPDGGAPNSVPATLSRFAGAGWTKSDVAAGVQAPAPKDSSMPWAVDPSGAHAYAPLAAVPMAGKLVTLGAPPAIATVDTGVAGGMFDPSGQNLLYRTQSGGLRRVAVSAPTSPIDLVSSGVTAFEALSPDGKYVTFSTTFGANGHDLSLAATTAAAPATVLDANPDAVRANDSFTMDSAYALFLTPSSAAYAWTLSAVPVAGGSAKTISKAVSGNGAVAGSLVVIDDGTWDDRRHGLVADVTVVDVSGVKAPVVLAQQALAGFYVTPDRRYVIYETPQQPAPGLYAAKLQ